MLDTVCTGEEDGALRKVTALENYVFLLVPKGSICLENKLWSRQPSDEQLGHPNTSYFLGSQSGNFPEAQSLPGLQADATCRNYCNLPSLQLEQANTSNER